MAPEVYRGELRGLDRELAEKRAARMNPEMLRDAAQWLSAVSGENVPADLSGMAAALRNGYVLALTVNKIAPGSIKSVKNVQMPFICLEQITNVVNAAQKLGVPDGDCFRAPDLFEAQRAESNFQQIIEFIHSLGRVAQKRKFAGPVLGAKLASAKPTEMTAEKEALLRGSAPAITSGKLTVKHIGVEYATTKY